MECIKAQNKDSICIYIDIFSTQNLNDFVQALGDAVVEEAVEREKTFAAKTLDAFKAMRPVLSYDPLTALPSISVTVDPSHEEHTLRSIFEHLNGLKKKVYIAIDEFQQVAQYPEKGTEALLRSHIQFSPVGFIFSGSKMHLMAELFNSPQRPFYQSTEFINLQPLPEQEYYIFANKFFEKKKGSLSEAVFHDIYVRFDGHTWYIQFILNRLYERYKKVETVAQANEIILSVVETLAPQYEMLLAFLTSNQINLLKAIAKEGRVVMPQSVEFIKKHDLPSASSVKTALNVLVDKELVYADAEGFIIYDRFLGIWLQRLR